MHKSRQKSKMLKNVLVFRQTDRQRMRETDRQTDRDRQTRETDRETDRQTDREERQTDLDHQKDLSVEVTLRSETCRACSILPFVSSS